MNHLAVLQVVDEYLEIRIIDFSIVNWQLLYGFLYGFSIIVPEMAEYVQTLVLSDGA